MGERDKMRVKETRHIQIPSYGLCLIAFLQGVTSVVKRRGVNSSQSVIPGWRSFLSTLKPCMNKTPGQYQEHPTGKIPQKMLNRNAAYFYL